jgi:hypothetical protein
MGTGIHNKYNIALNGAGYILQGSPDRPAYKRSVVASEVDRLSISDLAYSDFAGSGLFYIAQTDWSAGTKNEITWKDDGKFYYSKNIDVFSEQGAIKVVTDLTSEKDFTPGINCGIYEELGGASYHWVGTEDEVYYKYSGTWTAMADPGYPANYIIAGLVKHKSFIWWATCAATYTVISASNYNGSSIVDHSDPIETAMGYSALNIGSCIWSNDDNIFVGVADSTDEKFGICKSADGGSTWSSLINFVGNVTNPSSQGGNFIFDGISVGADQYYLVVRSWGYELRVYNTTDSTDLLVYKFFMTGTNVTYKFRGSGKFLHYLNGKLIITIPNNEIHEYILSSGDMNTIWDNYGSKSSIGQGDIQFGGTLHKGKVYWGGLVYDGTNLYNWKYNDAESGFVYPKYSDGSLIYYTDLVDNSILWKDNTSAYKDATDENYLIFNEMAPVASIDKLLYSVTLIFKQLAANESIKIVYSIDNMSNWVTVGTLTLATEGTGVKKEIIIPGSIIFNKIWWKIFLLGTSTTTPTVYDFIVAYKPMPYYKNEWWLRVNCSDGIKLLNHQSEEKSGLDLYAQLWNDKAKKQKMIFEDLDYVECALRSAMTSADVSAAVTNTNHFAKQGRIRVVSGNVAEEMYYTSATPNKILGISRAQRGTTARAYSSGAIIKNDFDVYIDDITTEAQFTDEKKLESSSLIHLIEI